MKFPITCHATINQLKEQCDMMPLLQEAHAQPSIDLWEDVDITRTDWHNGKDFSRQWVQYFMPFLSRHLHEHLEPFNDFLVHDIWFQQYTNNSQHGWHTHSHNFTGVYYVQLPPNSQTEIIVPYTKEQQTLPVEQNDLIIFPSTVVHRAPPASNKTIISFNFDAFYHYKSMV